MSAVITSAWAALETAKSCTDEKCSHVRGIYHFTSSTDLKHWLFHKIKFCNFIPKENRLCSNFWLIQKSIVIYLPYVGIYTRIFIADELLHILLKCNTCTRSSFCSSLEGVVLASHVASQGCTERICSTKQVTSHLCHSQTASVQHLHVFQSDGRKRWPVMTPLHYTCPQDHWGKDSVTPSFPFLRKKAHTQLQLISLLKQCSSGCFSGLSVVLTKAVPIHATRSQLCAEEVSVAACARAVARAGRAGISCYWACCSGTPKLTPVIPLAKFSSPAKPPGICAHFSCTNMV